MSIKRFFRWGIVFIMAMTFLNVLGCATSPARPAPRVKRDRSISPSQEKPLKSVKRAPSALRHKEPGGSYEPGKKHAPPDPRMMASLNLTSQGESYVRAGRYDEAIHVLERSLSIHSANGESCYFLAEAWLKKGNISQAREFNRLAERYLKEDRTYINRILKQKKQIEFHGVKTK